MQLDVKEGSSQSSNKEEKYSKKELNIHKLIIKKIFAIVQTFTEYNTSFKDK